MPAAFTDLAGRTFGRLTVISRHPCNGIVRWQCSCKCGGTAIVASVALKNGYTKSCGCLRRETSKKRMQARSRRGGIANGLRLTDPAWRTGAAPASKSAYVPVKQWAGAEEALDDLASVWARVWLPRLSAMPVLGVTARVSEEPWE